MLPMLRAVEGITSPRRCLASPRSQPLNRFARFCDKHPMINIMRAARSAYRVAQKPPCGA